MSYFEDSSNEAAVAVHTPAGYGKRVLGAIIDALLALVAGAVPIVVFLIGLVAAIDADKEGEPAAGGMMMLLGGVGGLVWIVWMAWLFGYRQGATGKTPGKRVAGTRLTRIGTDEAPGGGIGVGRFLVPSLINNATGGVYMIIDYLWPLWDDDNQRLTDKMFSTQVVLDSGPSAPTAANPIS
jgi:uncharacterized RDD family membrane protein YckC